MELKTPLYACHEAAQGSMTPFAGYLLPLQYPSGIIAEHQAVRTGAGLFDVSHMGEIFISGPDAPANIDNLLCNEFCSLINGRVRYSPMLNDRGGIVDDLIVYRFSEECFMLVVNASNRAKDIAWIEQHLVGDATLTDRSDSLAEIALQGPQALNILAKLAEPAHIPERYYSFVSEASISGITCLISRTGYTGELGYEFYLPHEHAPRLWQILLEAGEEYGLIPCGLGARDTLRLEAGMPLYGHEMSDEITPLEADLGFAVKLEKEHFIGRQALIAAGEPKRKRIGLKVITRGIIREETPLFLDEEQIGYTTSGTFAPHLGYGIAMAMLPQEYCHSGLKLEARARGRHITAETVGLPFYRASK